MALGRDDRWLADAQGRALAGAQVYWLSQPATVPTDPPPSPEIATYTDLTGTTVLPQPVFTDGFGHAAAYLNEGVLFTVAMYHPLFGEFPVIVPDQILGGGSGGGSTVTPFEGTLAGTVDGINKVFTLTNGGTPLTVPPTQATVWNNFPLVPGIGYTLVGVTVTFTTAPEAASGGAPADVPFARGITIA